MHSQTCRARRAPYVTRRSCVARRATRNYIRRWPYIASSASWRDGREAEGTGLLNRHRGSTSIEGSNPSLSAPKARRRPWRAFVLSRPFAPPRRHDSAPPPSPPLRPLAHRLPPRRRRAHGALQLALRAQVRRPVPAAHRGHRQGAQHRREHARDLRGARVARPRLGRGGRLPGREPRAPPAPTRSACSTTARRTAASARRRSSTSAAPRPRRARTSFKYDRRCDRLAADEVAAPRRRRRCRSSSASACPRARRRGTTSCTSDIAFPNKDIEDFIVLRSDGTPIYNMAVVSRRHRDAHHARHARRRPHLEHAEADPALPGARRRAAAVRAPADDPRHRRQEAQQAARRDGGGRLPAPRHPAAGDAQLPRAARLVAGRRHRGDDAAAR